MRSPVRRLCCFRTLRLSWWRVHHRAAPKCGGCSERRLRPLTPLLSEGSQSANLGCSNILRALARSQRSSRRRTVSMSLRRWFSRRHIFSYMSGSARISEFLSFAEMFGVSRSPLGEKHAQNIQSEFIVRRVSYRAKGIQRLRLRRHSYKRSTKRPTRRRSRGRDLSRVVLTHALHQPLPNEAPDNARGA